ncbi:ChaN family lipoprotein [Variovorax sp. HJSM1_2]|uniref:ChaN family lipoprotein n=1 Tax=Variovorax sp. HJSM1_2 TaxID=3366263 RepID=UPI003BCD5FD6
MTKSLTLIATLALAACGTITTPTTTADVAQRVSSLLPADAILLGEKHDIAEHQQLHQQVTAALAARGQLAALTLEMADLGGSTAGLPRNASDAEVQKALRWNDAGWPWKAYGPAVMTAVAAGVPVLGANLPRSQMRQAMGNNGLDPLLPPAQLQAQQNAIRAGHCNQLPESQIAPMTRIQIARDQTMAQTVAAAVVPGKTVLLLAGGGHVDRALGVPHYLPATLSVKAVEFAPAGAAPAAARGAVFDVAWATAAAPEKDYCAELSKTLKRD